MFSGIGGALRLLPPVKDNKLQFIVVVEPYDLSFVRTDEANQDTRYNAKLDYVVVQRDKNGRNIDGTNRTITLALQKERYQEILKTGLRLNETIEIKSGAAELRIVLRDASTGNLGSLIAPLTEALAANSAPAQ